MLKLLISADRHILRREYIFRVMNVYLVILICMSGIVSALLYIPYTFIKVEDVLVSNELSAAKITDGSKKREDFEKMGRHVQAEYNLFINPVIHPHEIVNMMRSKTTAGIEITAMNFLKVSEDNTKVSAKIEISGIATDRDSLVAYSKNIQNDPFFKTIDIPFSSFAQESNIAFNAIIETIELTEK